MGDARKSTLASIWTGPKYRAIREQLLTGRNLTPYCRQCEYRANVPAWMMQLHLNLYGYWSGIRTPEILGNIRRLSGRHKEYKTRGAAIGTPPLELPDLPNGPISNSLSEELLSARRLPIGLDLNTLNRCNVSCVMCPPALMRANGQAPDAYYRLTKQEFANLTHGVNLAMAHFIGAYAEPLLNKDIFSLIEQAKQAGSLTAITTNAVPLVPRFADRLLDAGLDYMTVSLHGATAPTAESIMRGSKFERVIGNIKTFNRKKRERGVTQPVLRINFVSQRANIHETADMVRLASELDVSTLYIIHLIDGAAEVDSSTSSLNYPDLMKPQLLEARRLGLELDVEVNISPAFFHLLGTPH